MAVPRWFEEERAKIDIGLEPSFNENIGRTPINQHTIYFIMEHKEIPSESLTQDKYYAWANEVFAQSSFDAKVSNLMGLVAALVLGYDGSVKYFYFSAEKAGATEAELLDAANIAAAASGLNVYARMPKDSVEPPE